MDSFESKELMDMQEHIKLNDKLNDTKRVLEEAMRYFCHPTKMVDYKDNRRLLGNAIMDIAEFQKQIYLLHPKLAPAPEKPKPARELTPLENELCGNLTHEQLNIIDESILANVKSSYRKVAMVVGLAIKTSIDGLTIPDIFYSQRVKHLVEKGVLDSVGDVKKMRFSEIKKCHE